MVSSEKSMTATTDHLSQYELGSNSANQRGELNSDFERVAEQIILTCGLGRTLDIGSGQGLLTASLLRRGVDAQGVDVSEIAIAHCNKRMPGRFTCGSVLALPFENSSFDTAVSANCLEKLAPEDVPKALREIYRVASRYALLRIDTSPGVNEHFQLTVEGRAWWEQKCFEAGFRKHPAYYELNEYESLNSDGRRILIPLEKIREPVLDTYPISALAEERSLHMDMLRETGRRSDGHVFHYHFASNYVRPGDVVLDAACGLGYGSHVLLSNSGAQKVIGVDLSPYAVDYASSMYGSKNINFFKGHAEKLTFLDDSSVDLICSFETLEHVKDPKALLHEFDRVLKPTGRLIVSVPNLWVDETGQDPNPWHFHVYDWPKLNKQLSDYFLIDERFNQIAGGGFKLPSSPRVFRPFNASKSCENPDSEWCIAVAFKSSRNSQSPFEDSVNPYSKPPDNLLDFATHYHNPWLIREICETKFRIKNEEVLSAQCRHLIESGDKKSADYGAALCVYGYRVLESQEHAASDIYEIEKKIADYVALGSDNPHVLRWQTSLSYVAGLLFQKIGNTEKQRIWLHKCTSFEYLKFSPVLATKIVAAARNIGYLMLAKGDETAAITHFKKAALISFEAIKSPAQEWIGKIDWPLTCTYFDAMQLLDDGLHSAALMSELLSGHSSRLVFNRFALHGNYRDSSVTKVAHNNSLLKLQKLGSEYQGLYDTAEQRLTDLRRLAVERQELYDTAEQRLSELQRLGAERQELYEVAERRLSELHQLVTERQELYDTAEQRLSELQRLGAERQELYQIAEQRLLDLNQLIVRLTESENRGLMAFLANYFKKKIRTMMTIFSRNEKAKDD